MSRQHHELNVETKFYQQIERGDAKFLVCKNDANFMVYDIIYLFETVNGINTGRKILPLEIKYVLSNIEGLGKNYCIICW